MVEVEAPDSDFLINFIFRLLISSSKRGATNKFPRLPSEISEIKKTPEPRPKKRRWLTACLIWTSDMITKLLLLVFT